MKAEEDLRGEVVLPIDRTRPTSLLGRVLLRGLNESGIPGLRCYLAYDGCCKWADSVEHVIPKSKWAKRVICQDCSWTGTETTPKCDRCGSGNLFLKYVSDPNVKWNLKPACRSCNVKKGDKMPEGVQFQFGTTAWRDFRKDPEFRPCAQFRGWYCSHAACKIEGLSLGATAKGHDGRQAGNAERGAIRPEALLPEPVAAFI